MTRASLKEVSYIVERPCTDTPWGRGQEGADLMTKTSEVRWVAKADSFIEGMHRRLIPPLKVPLEQSANSAALSFPDISDISGQVSLCVNSLWI